MNQIMPTALRTIIAFIVALSLADNVSAHPFHFSFGEANWNAESKKLEVALRLETRELEAALRTKDRPDFNLDDGKADKIVADYLQRHFRFSHDSGKPIAWKWIGMEVSVKETWAYLEVPLATGPEGVTIANTILLSEILEQVNVLAVNAGQRSQRLQFSAKQSKQVVELREPNGER